MGFLSKIFSSGASKLVNSVGNAIDKNITSKEEKLKAIEEVSKVITDYDKYITDVQKEIMLAEIHGNKLQRSWRPILMYTSTFVVFSMFFIFPLINVWLDNQQLFEFYSNTQQAEPFWGIIKLGIGAFGIGRSAEKISRELSSNLSVSVKRKKDK